jgi:conjugal transfer mating pair stabilization protein TraN
VIKLVLFLLSLFEISSAIVCTNYNDFTEYNGHYYAISTELYTYNEAKAIALNNNGYIAVPNTQAENDYLKSIVGGSKAIWLGIEDLNGNNNYNIIDNVRFSTYDGKTLLYSNWQVNQPDNLLEGYDVINGISQVSPLGENWVILSGNDGKWYDVGNHTSSNNNPYKAYFIIEFIEEPICFLSDDPNTELPSNKVCNTKVWDQEIDTVTVGATLDCKQDEYGTDYCPEALANADAYWDYEDGYSVQQSISLSIEPNCSGVMSNGICYEQLGSATKITNLSCRDISVPCMPGASSCCHIDFSCSDGVATVKYYDCCPSAGSLKKTTVVGDPNKFIDGVTYQKYGDAKIICNTSGACSIYFQNYYCSGGLIGDIFRSQSFTINTSTEYQCNDNEFIGTSAYQSADPTQCYGASIPTCDKGELNNISNKCELNYSYYNYLCSNETNDQNETFIAEDEGNIDCTPITTNDLIDTNNDGIGDSCNSPIPPTNNCKREGFTCNSEIRDPVWIDNTWQCSPYPCIGDNNFNELDTTFGDNDKTNDGWSENGDCLGQIYIFNGDANKCRNWDMFFGLAGGGCCDKDKVFLGLVNCKANEKKLAKEQNAELCHKIGDFCSKELNLLFSTICIQKSDSYCCFNSKLAKVIIEQGRPQLGISWGSAQNPECRGFTPEEFQKLDFSKIDLSNAIDIPNVSDTDIVSATDNLIENLQNMYGE